MSRRVLICPDCGFNLYPDGGCWSCLACGFSACSGVPDQSRQRHPQAQAPVRIIGANMVPRAPPAMAPPYK
jgi:hypothetical protein